LSSPVGEFEGTFAAIEELCGEKAAEVEKDEAASLGREVVFLMVFNVL
jgi:hypothetical protein